jgi:electron transport complex protein RnfC
MMKMIGKTIFEKSIKIFRHGTHPGDYKETTKALRIERMPFTEEYVLPLSQHLGAPSKPTVKPGEKVFHGQLIAEAGGFVSSSLHASVTGRHNRGSMAWRNK